MATTIPTRNKKPIQHQNNSNNRNKKKISSNDFLFYIISLIAICISFIIGTMSGIKQAEHMSLSSLESKCSSGRTSNAKYVTWDKEEAKKEVDRRVNEEIKKQETTKPRRSKSERSKSEKAIKKVVKTDIFKRNNGGSLKGVSRVNKNDFLSKYDFGTPNHPYDPSSEGLIFYSSKEAYPSSSSNSTGTSKGDIPLLSAEDAVQNCDVLNVLMSQSAECIAIVGDYESFHVQKWMRVGEHGTKLSKSYPLQMVGRARTPGGTNIFRPPTEDLIQKNFANLRKFLNAREDILAKLKPIVERIAVENTIVVMTCNLGQVSLLVNFVCASKARNLDISNVLLFATDQEAYDVALSLGLAAFYDEKNFEDIPSKEARFYQDKTFVKMMYAKVIAAQTINFLEYDILFQDVDVFWYKNPLELFHDQESPLYKFDAIFTRDGASSPRYAPYDANSGFYYIRFNDKTRYMLTTMLYYGDLIESTRSHQAAFQAVLAEHSSLFGVQVKVLDEEEFPGGHLFHKHDHTYMKNLIQGSRWKKQEVHPWIFHMCWTKNKDDKEKYMKQMGWWYVNKKCNKIETYIKGKKEYSHLEKDCCATEPQFECFYRDKASMKPCKDSPPIDRNHKSFW